MILARTLLFGDQKTLRYFASVVSIQFVSLNVLPPLFRGLFQKCCQLGVEAVTNNIEVMVLKPQQNGRIY